MENISLILIITLFTLSIIANFFMYQQIKDLGVDLTKETILHNIKINFFNSWLHKEIEGKRIYSHLSMSVIKERDLLNFKYKTLKKAIFMYLDWNMSKEDLKSKLK